MDDFPSEALIRPEMENCILPMELLIEIFSRLPVKSLMRFKCVCKFLYCLIKRDHQFKNKHYEISRSKSDGVFFKRDVGSSDRAFSLVYKDPDSDEIRCRDLDLPSSCIRGVKCVDGMLCLIVSRVDAVSGLNYDVSIWNPSTRETKTLPSIQPPKQFPINSLIQVFYLAFGFGFSNDMNGKVVMLWGFIEASRKTFETAMICSEAGDSWGWRQINAFQYDQNICWVDTHADFYSKGKYYWCVNAYWPAKDLLLWFDISDEVFGTIGLPPRPPGKSRNDGLRCMWTGDDIIALIGHASENVWDVWFLNQSSNTNNVGWHKQASIDLNGYQFYYIPLKIWNLNRHLLVYLTGIADDDDDDDDVGSLISIDLVTQGKVFISNICFRGCYNGLGGIPYSESLKLF